MKRKKFSSIWFTDSLINDISRADEDDQGIPILFPNIEIRKMLRLARVNRNDIFYDLGCGWGQNIKIALTEFNVKLAIGFEHNTERNKIATERLNRLEKIGIKKSRWQIRSEDFEEKLLKDKIRDVNLRDATVVFYGLSTSKSLLTKIKKHVRKGCRLICYHHCLFPEIMPDENGVNYPFFVHTAPFKKTTSELAWLNTVVRKTHSMYNSRKSPTKEELWDELHHDYDVEMGDSSYADDYQKRLEKLLKFRKNNRKIQ